MGRRRAPPPAGADAAAPPSPPGEGGQKQTKKVVRFAKFFVHLVEAETGDVPAPGRLGVCGEGDRSRTTVLECGAPGDPRVSEDPDNYVAMTFFDTMAGNGGTEAVKTVVEGFLGHLNVTVPSKHVLDTLFAFNGSVQAAMGAATQVVPSGDEAVDGPGALPPVAQTWHCAVTVANATLQFHRRHGGPATSPDGHRLEIGATNLKVDLRQPGGAQESMKASVGMSGLRVTEHLVRFQGTAAGPTVEAPLCVLSFGETTVPNRVMVDVSVMNEGRTFVRVTTNATTCFLEVEMKLVNRWLEYLLGGDDADERGPRADAASVAPAAIELDIPHALVTVRATPAIVDTAAQAPVDMAVLSEAVKRDIEVARKAAQPSPSGSAATGKWTRAFRNDYLVVSLRQLNVALGSAVGEGRNARKAMRAVQPEDTAAARPGEAHKFLSSVLTFETLEVDRKETAPSRTDKGPGTDRGHLIEGAAGRLPNGRQVLPTIAVHVPKTLPDVSRLGAEPPALVLHKDVNVKSGQFRSFEPSAEESSAQKGEREGTGSVEERRKRQLVRENQFVRFGLSVIEVGLPMGKLCCDESEYIELMDFIDCIVADNTVTPPEADAAGAGEPLGEGDSDAEDEDEAGAFTITDSTLVLQILKCEVVLSEIDVPEAMKALHTVEIAESLEHEGVFNDKGDEYYHAADDLRGKMGAARKGRLRANFFDRLIETLKQRLYHTQAFKYSAVLSDLQLFNVSGRHVKRDRDTRKLALRTAYPQTYMRISAADLVLKDSPAAPAAAGPQDPVLYGTKWGSDCDDLKKYATHVPFGNCAYGVLLWMIVSNDYKPVYAPAGAVHQEPAGTLVEGKVDGDVYGSTFRYNVTSGWLFRMLGLVLNPRRRKPADATVSGDDPKGAEEDDTYTSVHVRFHDTLVDYTPAHIDTRCILSIGSFQISSTIVGSSDSSTFQVGMDDVACLVRQNRIPYHVGESQCLELVHPLHGERPRSQRFSNVQNHPMMSLRRAANSLSSQVGTRYMDAGRAPGMAAASTTRPTKLTIWDVEHILCSAGFVKVMGLDHVSVLITDREPKAAGASPGEASEDGKGTRIPTEITVDMGQLSLYTCYDSFTKLLDLITLWYEEFGPTDPFLKKWINRRRRQRRRNKKLQKIRDMQRVSDKQKKVLKMTAGADVTASPDGSPLSLLSGLQENAFGESPGRLAGSPVEALGGALQGTSISENAAKPPSLVMIEDFYNLNDSTKANKTNSVAFGASSDNESESSFEMLDMEDYSGGGPGRPAAVLRPAKPAAAPPRVPSTPPAPKREAGPSSDDDDFGPGGGSSSTLMLSWFGGGDQASPAKSEEPIELNNLQDRARSPRSSPLPAHSDSVTVSEDSSNGHLNIFFDTDLSNQLDASIPALTGNASTSPTSSPDASLMSTVATLVDGGDDSGRESLASHEDLSSDEDGGSEEESSEEEDGELWESAYGFAPTAAKDVPPVAEDGPPPPPPRTTPTAAAPEQARGGEDSYFEGEEGAQNVGWYGKDEPAARVPVTIRPHYIPQPARKPIGGAANGRGSSSRKASKAYMSVSEKQNPADAGRVIMRLEIRRMDVSWKWFDGKDWVGNSGEFSHRRQSASTQQQLFGREKPEADEAGAARSSSRKTTLLGVLLEDHEQAKVADVDEGGNEEESVGQAWWNASEYYTIPCGRKVETMVELDLVDFSLRSDSFDKHSPYTSNLFLHVHDFEIIDHISTSLLKKVLSHWRSSRLHPRETHSSMLRLNMLNVRTDTEDEQSDRSSCSEGGVEKAGNGAGRADQPYDYVPDDEVRARLGLLPLRVNLDQDTAYFIGRFLSNAFSGAEDAEKGGKIAAGSPARDDGEADGARPGEASEESVEDTPEMFFQSIVISSVKLKMDYHPKRVDLNGLREGNYVELLNVLPMEGLCLLLPKVELYSLNGFGELGEKVTEVWAKEIVERQLHHLAAGINVPPVRSLANVCNGAADVVLLPLQQYKEGHLHRVAPAVGKGASSFLHTMTLEALSNASRLAATTQNVLEAADSWVRSGRQGRGKKGRRDRKQPGAGGGRPRSTSNPFSDQPANFTEALAQAADRLSRRAKQASRTVVAVPVGQYRRRGIGGAMRSVVRAVPVAILEPMIGGTEALSRVILGARNALDPDLKHDQDNKYKSGKKCAKAKGRRGW
jgi:hypothetical protein